MKKSVVLVAPVWGLLALSLLGLAGCSSGENSNTGGTGGTRASEPDTTIARIEIAPGAVVLTEAGKTYQLTAQAYNAAEQAIDADFTWTSSDPADVEVGSMGLVEAMVPIGSAQITAEAQGVTSSPAVVTLARPVAGAVFVSDDQVVEGPSFDGEPADFGMGSLIQLTLEGIGAPKVGDILLPQETLSVGGRVAAVEETSPGVFLVSLEVIPLSEMYEEFAINERFRLTVDETMVTERVAELYDVEQKADGSFVFTRKPDAVLPKAAVGTRAVDVFECEYPDGVNFTLTVSPPTFDVDPDLDVIVEWDSSHIDRRLVLVGGLKAEFSTKVSLTLSVEAGIVCKIDVFHVPGPRLGIPFLYAGAVFPIGVGLGLSGKINLPLNLEVGIKPSAQITAGVRCPADQEDCDFFGSGDVSFSVPVITPSVDLIGGDYNLRFEPQIEAFAFADLRIGVDLFVAEVQYTTFTAKAGLVQKASLATLKTQFNNARYASNYGLDLEISASAANSTKMFLDLLSVNANLLTIKFTEPWVQSPTLAKATVDVTEYEQQDDVTFEVKLKPEDVYYFASVYNVDKVLIYELQELSDGTKVAQERASVTPISDGQTDFTIPWKPITTGDIGERFFAAVETSLLPKLPDPLTFGILELGKVVADPAEICDNEKDDEDDDDLIDCCDEECTGEAHCVEVCTGGLDEDCDLLIDCDDPDCVGDPACGTPGCPPEPRFVLTGEPTCTASAQGFVDANGPGCVSDQSDDSSPTSASCSVATSGPCGQASASGNITGSVVEPVANGEFQGASLSVDWVNQASASGCSIEEGTSLFAGCDYQFSCEYDFEAYTNFRTTRSSDFAFGDCRIGGGGTGEFPPGSYTLLCDVASASAELGAAQCPEGPESTADSETGALGLGLIAMESCANNSDDDCDGDTDCDDADCANDPACGGGGGCTGNCADPACASDPVCSSCFPTEVELCQQTQCAFLGQMDPRCIGIPPGTWPGPNDGGPCWNFCTPLAIELTCCMEAEVGACTQQLFQAGPCTEGANSLFTCIETYCDN